MIEAHWLLFVIASVAIIATPGQDMILVISRSITHGGRAGVATAAGVSVGLVGHTLLATAGLGVLLQTSAWLFTALKLIGAAYLLYLGVQMMRTRSAVLAEASTAPQSRHRLFLAGATSNIGNPKIAVFYFAFLPQFVVAGARHPTATIAVLGLVFAAMTFAIKGPAALFAARLSTWLRARPNSLVWLYRCSGLVLVGLALRLALARKD